jgi:diguanylate cyclase (GGDEF)-like protein
LGVTSLPSGPLPTAIHRCQRLAAIGVFQLASIVTALVAAEMFERSWGRITEAAQVDPLTGLMSRRFLFERLEQVWRLRGRRDMAMALVLTDVDHLKTVNDRHGHSAGDEMLRVVSSAVDTVIRNTDFAGRLGGDEFVLALLGCDGPRAIEVVDRLRNHLAVTPLLFHGTTIRVTISAGVAAVPLADHRDVARVLRDADAALYQSKAAGRDRTSLSAAS